MLWLLLACSNDFADGYAAACPWGDHDGCLEGSIDGGLCLDDNPEPFILATANSYGEGVRAGYLACYEPAYADCFEREREDIEDAYGDDICDG